MMNFERFTEKAQETVQRAQSVMLEHNHNQLDAEHILLRTVRCVSGTVELVMSCEPSFGYHRVVGQQERSGPHTGFGLPKDAAVERRVHTVE